MSAPTWLSSESELPAAFSATVGKTEELLRPLDISGDPRAMDKTDAVRTAAASASASSSSSGAGAATLEARRVKKIEKDLLAIIEEDTALSIDATTVTKDVRLAARTITKKREATMRGVLRQIRTAQQVHLAFLVDTTGSMSPHIAGVREQIQRICAFLTACTGAALRTGAKQQGGGGNSNSNSVSNSVSVAFVGYKDFCDGANHFEIFDFTKDIAAFQAFVGRVIASGGGDGPEDVNGGLRKAVDALQWAPPGSTNVLFHISDAPPHGAQYTTMHSDSVSIHGMSLHDEPIERLFARMQQRGIDYYFGKINNSTDAMVQIFGAALGRKVQPFDVADPGKLTESVTMASVASVASRVKDSMCMVSPGMLKTLTIDKIVPTWSALRLQQGSLVEYRFPESIEQILDYVEFDHDTRKALFKIAPRPFAQGSLRFAFYAQEYLPVGRSGAAATATMASASSSATTTAGTATDAAEWSVIDQVCKEFKDKGRTDLGTGSHERYRYMIDMEVQTIASFLAIKYNQLQAAAKSDAGYKIRYLKSKVLALKSSADAAAGAGGFRYYAVERKFREGEDKWVKVINNAGAVASSSPAFTSGGAGASGHEDLADEIFCEYLTAFAHWTYEATGGYLMVTDLQGIKLSSSSSSMSSAVSSSSSSSTSRAKAAAAAERAVTPDTILLTDPAIHCTASTRFGRTNLGKRGMQLFFNSHKCNRFCRAVKLSHAPIKGSEVEDDDGEADEGEL